MQQVFPRKHPLIGIVAGVAIVGASTHAMAASSPQPYIQDFAPSTGPVGTVITVTGSGFTGLNQAWIGNAHDGAIKVLSDSKVQVTVPKDAVAGQLALLNPLHASFSPNKFTVASSGVTTTGSSGSSSSSGSPAKATTTSAPQPYIASYSPHTGPKGTVITVTGSGFTGLTYAWLGASHDARVAVVSDTKATLTVPTDGVSGQIALFNSKHVSFSADAFSVTAGTVSSASNPTPVPTSGGSTSGTSTGTGKIAGTGTGTTSTPSTGTGPGTGIGSGTGTGTSKGTGPTIAPSASLRITVSGDHFIDGSGRTVQLRGANVSGLEFVAVQGWDPANAWGGQAGATTPQWTSMKSWDINVVRLPLNEASWLGYTCVDASGQSHNPDPGHNYQATVKQAVADATAAGLYVIIDLHWTAPKNFCPLAQNPMADADNSLRFWNSIATQFKGYPNVLFELFNEPYMYWLESPNTEWQTEMQGGSITSYVTGGNPYQVNYTWQVASMQAMIDTVRATGATNPVLVAGVNWAGDLSQWLANKPRDPRNQLAAVWHAYPAYGSAFGSAAYTLPGGGEAAFTNAQSVISAGVPVVISESGDQNTAGTSGAPFESKLLPWADKAGASYLGWAWDVWQDASNVLIKDANGTPTDGYGVYFKQHLLCAASGATNCR